MGASVGDFTGNIYDEEKRYVQGLLQQGKEWVDRDQNDIYESGRRYIQRYIQNIYGDASPNSGFLIVGTGASNDFTITGGGGSGEDAGRMYVGGLPCLLFDDVAYAASTNDKTTPISTALTATVLTDSAANFTLGGANDNLVGREIVPNIVDGTSFTITANTQTTITITVGDMTTVAAAGDNYRLNLSTPGGSPRTDEVYLDVWTDEIDGAEDTDLVISEIGSAAQLRLQVKQLVLVAEDDVTPADYVDADGRQHHITKIATLSRPAATAPIDPGDVTDNRIVQTIGGAFLDVKVKISGADTTADFLFPKIVSTSGKITKVIGNPAGNETVDLDIDESALDAGQLDLSNVISYGVLEGLSHHANPSDNTQLLIDPGVAGDVFGNGRITSSAQITLDIDTTAATDVSGAIGSLTDDRWLGIYIVGDSSGTNTTIGVVKEFTAGDVEQPPTVGELNGIGYDMYVRIGCVFLRSVANGRLMRYYQQGNQVRYIDHTDTIMVIGADTAGFYDGNGASEGLPGFVGLGNGTANALEINNFTGAQLDVSDLVCPLSTMGSFACMFAGDDKHILFAPGEWASVLDVQGVGSIPSGGMLGASCLIIGSDDFSQSFDIQVPVDSNREIAYRISTETSANLEALAIYCSGYVDNV